MHDELDRVLAAAVSDGALPGIAAAVVTADGEWTGAAGQATGTTAMAPDTIVFIASMTKAVTATGVMQLVETGQLDLDAPCAELVPYLAEVAVIERVDPDGTPVLRPPRRPVTLRHLLTHTSGFGYDFTDATLGRLAAARPGPEPAPGSRASLETPLLFDPGEGWVYGTGIDWAGQVVEAAVGQRLDAYLEQSLLEPLGMVDTAFGPPAGRADRVATMHARTPDGLLPIPFELPAAPEVVIGGGGLYSTVVDYLRFVRMVLGRGAADGQRVLRPETVAAMAANHVGDLQAGGWATTNPALSCDVDFFPGQAQRWGLSFLINAETTPEGRTPGSLAWAGIANSYYWIDPARQVGGVVATQLLPFFDPTAVEAFRAVERTVYRSL